MPFDFRFALGLTSSSLSDSSFFAAFFALLSLARIDLASFSAFFSIEAFFLASFVVSGSSSPEDSSPKAAAVTLGEAFLASFWLPMGRHHRNRNQRPFWRPFDVWPGDIVSILLADLEEKFGNKVTRIRGIFLPMGLNPHHFRCRRNLVPLMCWCGPCALYCRSSLAHQRPSCLPLRAHSGQQLLMGRG